MYSKQEKKKDVSTFSIIIIIFSFFFETYIYLTDL